MILLKIYIPKIHLRSCESESLEIYMIKKLSSWFLHKPHHYNHISLIIYFIKGFYYISNIHL